jgi:uncharacterized protein (DUF934 family)
MSPVISSSELIEDIWATLDDHQFIDDRSNVIVSFNRLTQQWDRLVALPINLGVILEPTSAVEDVIPFLDQLQIVVLQFKAFADGRAFSQARLLRDRYAYRGDIRAVGNVFCDQLWFMKRSGFNQFQPGEGEDLELAFRIFGEISQTYQTELKQSLG